MCRSHLIVRPDRRTEVGVGERGVGPTSNPAEIAQAALSLFRRLPQGRALSRSTSELNTALEALGGRTLDRVSVHSVGPGEYGVTISAEGVELALRLGPNGARISTIGT